MDLLLLGILADIIENQVKSIRPIGNREFRVF